MNLEERIERLESDNEMCGKIVCAFIIIGVICLASSSIHSFISSLFSPDEVIEIDTGGDWENASVRIHAGRDHILITDAHDKPLAWMGTDRSNRGRVALYGNDEKPMYITTKEE